MHAVVPFPAMICRRPDLCVALAAALLLPLAGIAAAQTADRLETLKQRDKELEAARIEQRKSAEQEAALKREIENLGADRRKLNQELIDTANLVRGLESRIGATETRLKPLDEKEATIRKSLDGRRAVIAEVLAALQRIGRRPPPALLANPEDALQAARTAMVRSQ